MAQRIHVVGRTAAPARNAMRSSRTLSRTARFATLRILMASGSTFRMRGGLSGIHRGRNAELAALLCCVIAGALALWLLVRLIWALVPRGDAALEVAPARIADGGTSGPVPAQSIANWHLFGTSRFAPGASGAAPATTLSLILRGTFASSDPHTGIAVIAGADGNERAYSVGDEVTPGAHLSAVYPDRIVLRHEGVDESLKLPRDRNLAPGDIVKPTPATTSSRIANNAVAGASPIAAMQASTASNQAPAPADWQQTVARMRQNPAELMQRVQVVPVLDGGKLTGVRLSANGDPALMRQIGLMPGDVVTQVNGVAIDSYARAQEIVSHLGNSSSVNVIVLRDGKPVALTVSLQ